MTCFNLSRPLLNQLGPKHNMARNALRSDNRFLKASQNNSAYKGYLLVCHSLIGLIDLLPTCQYCLALLCIGLIQPFPSVPLVLPPHHGLPGRGGGGEAGV